MGSSGFRLLGKGSGITDIMAQDLLVAFKESGKASKDGNDRCTFITKYAKEKYGGVWQAIMIPYGPAGSRGGSIKWLDEAYLYMEYEPGKCQIWLWKTGSDIKIS